MVGRFRHPRKQDPLARSSSTVGPDGFQPNIFWVMVPDEDRSIAKNAGPAVERKALGKRESATQYAPQPVWMYEVTPCPANDVQPHCPQAVFAKLLVDKALLVAVFAQAVELSDHALPIEVRARRRTPPVRRCPRTRCRVPSAR